MKRRGKYICVLITVITLISCGRKNDDTNISTMKTETENTHHYIMQFAADPAKPDAQKNVRISLTPADKEHPGETVTLDTIHEKKLHLIIVSEDLSFFDHQHPEYISSGEYALTYAFPSGGKFYLYADYKPSGAVQHTDRWALDVQGNTTSPVTYTKEKLFAEVENIQVNIPVSEPLIAGTEIMLEVAMQKENIRLDAGMLDDYLGAKAHIVIIGTEDKNYQHVHPMVHNGKLTIHTLFEKPGIYRAWIQFQYQGKIYTADFVLDVTGSTDTTSAPTHHH